MSSHSGQTSTFSTVPPHLPFDQKQCPTCEQEIPPDKLEEIGGKIAAKEREQRLAITSQLEKQHATEKAQAETKAKADVESERQQSAMRETRARDEAQKAAQKLIDAKLAEAEEARAVLVARWQQELVGAQSAQRVAEEASRAQRAEIDELLEKSARTIEALTLEGKQREIEIRNEATEAAQTAVAERIAGIEKARQEAEESLNLRVSEAEARSIAAEQRESARAAQLDELRQSNKDEIERLKQGVAAEILLVRQATAVETEGRFREALTARENAAADAEARAREAEAKVLTLTDEHNASLEANLKSQRDLLEKAKEDAVNAEKARAFEENQKLSNKVTDLQRALENKTAEELGEGAEIDLFESLRREFADDDIQRIPKGTPGADILHVIMHGGKKCGTIIYDSKNHNQFRHEHVSKLRADQLAAQAEHAILSTRKFPQGTRQLYLQDGVLLANPARVVLIATLIRQHLLQLHSQRVSDIEREGKTAALYEFIVSERCSSLLSRIDERAEDLLEQQKKEIRWHDINWKKQGEAVRGIQKAKADLENQLNQIIGTSANDAAA
jgi:hypothetical protein